MSLLINPFISFPGSGAAFNPLTEISWRHAAWADDPLWTPPANGAAVSSWRNGGTVGSSLTQSTSSAQPTFRSSVAGLNNKAAVDFDGTDALGLGAVASLSQGFTVIWIGALDDLPSADERLVDLRGDVGGSDFTSFLGNGASTGKFSMHAGGYAHSTVNASSGLVAAGRAYFNTGASAISINGTTTAVSLPSGAVAARFDLGASWVSGSSSWTSHSNNHTAFAGLYAGNITSNAAWPDFVAWVSSFYGLTIA